MGNKVLAQEDMNNYEDAGVGMLEPISQNDKGRIDRENAWELLMLAATVVKNLVAALPSAMLNNMAQGVNLGHGNEGGGSTNGGGTSVPLPNAAAAPSGIFRQPVTAS